MEVVYTPEFKRAVRKLSRRYRSLRTDIDELLQSFTAGETPGDQLQGVDSRVYKVRLRNSDLQKGKSGGYRVIYYIETPHKRVLVTLYSKSDQSDIPAEGVMRIVSKYTSQSQ